MSKLSNAKSEHVLNSLEVPISIDTLLLHFQPGNVLITESVFHSKKLLKRHAVDHRDVLCELARMLCQRLSKTDPDRKFEEQTIAVVTFYYVC